MKVESASKHYVTVSFCGFDQISRKLILSRFKDPQYVIELMEEPEDADLCLYNQEYLDEIKAIGELKDRLLQAEIPMILLTDADDVADDGLFRAITKPYQNRELSKYLYQVTDTFYALIKKRLKLRKKQRADKQIYNRHLSNAINPAQIQYGSDRYYAQKYVGLNADIDFADGQQVKAVQINANNYLFTYLKQAFELSAQKNKVTAVKSVYGTFYIDAVRKLIHHDKSADEIKNIHKIPFYKDTRVYLAKLKRGELDAMHAFDYEPFVWHSSINASKGKIPEDVNYRAPVKLTAWPDLSKLIVFKHAIRIMALWSRGVYSLQHTGKLLNIPQRYPLTVYTALHALGLITEVKRR
ncbi:hypothetical protein [Marinicella meishanensis]|uniref:hypothetical protein n=1 Tax=Marinicella meishanensis TaxID=2873263 RepID=UPI001CBD412C|nr:hypothetical protein [Marinicella sp. NBU2979]